MKKIIVLTTAILITITSYATHNMAGDISYTHLTGYTYRFTVRTFTNTLNTQADRCEVMLHVGADSLTLPRGNGPSSLCPNTHDGVMICTGVKYNIYEGDFTLPGPGTYAYFMQDLNMTAGICNVTNSINTLFSLTGEMVINSISGYNDTPAYSGVPLISNAAGILSNYYPGIVNTQGDSLYFDFVLPSGTTLPPASNSITINHQTGQIIWDVPNTICNYAIFASMKEYRNISGIYYYLGTAIQEIYTSDCSSDLLVNDNNETEAITIFPNPTDGSFNITTGKNTIQSVRITDVLGKEIKSIPHVRETQVVIEKGEMEKGIYFVRIEVENKSVVNRKIVIR